MKKMFLASSFQEVAHVLADWEKTLRGKTVTFIPTASRVERVTFYVSAGKQALEQLGLIVQVLEISTATHDEIRTKLEGNDYIYVTGGNTFYLLQELKRTGADRMIINEVNAGKLYIGESAGAIITAKSVEYVKEMDNAKKAPDLKSYDGFNLAAFYTLPHFQSPPFQKATRKIMERYSQALSLLPIGNKEAVLVNGDEIQMAHG